MKSAFISCASWLAPSASPPARPAQHFGVAVELTEQKRDRPAAHHPVPHPGIDGLQRIVPIAFAIANKMRAGDETFAHHGEKFCYMHGDRIFVCRPLKCVLAPPCDGFSSRKPKSPVASI